MLKKIGLGALPVLFLGVGFIAVKILLPMYTICDRKRA